MTEPVCTLCQEAIHGDPEDAYCYGCRSYICESCDVANPMGSHNPSDHFDDPDAAADLHPQD